MINSLLWTLLGIPIGCSLSVNINASYNLLYDTNISKCNKRRIVAGVIFFAFLKGYTNNNLYTNIFIFLSLLDVNLFIVVNLFRRYN